MFNRKKKITNHLLIKAWIKFAKDCHACEQCQYPWYDGLCDGDTCGFNKKNINISNEIARLAYYLRKEGWEL